MKLTFCGAAKEVSGSNFLIETDKHKFLIDCGMFQGGRDLEALNESPFPYNPKEIDFLILSHAHIDHSGRLPKLTKEGFTGGIYTTHPTGDLLEVMLKDSAKIQENDAEWANKKRMRAGKDLIEPLYSYVDVDYTLSKIVSHHYDEIFSPVEDVFVRFMDAGHILGSAIVEIWVKEDGQCTKIAFTGDLGMPDRPLIKDPEFVKSCDYLIMESTYGNTSHEDLDKTTEKLMEIVEESASQGGTVVIPSFAVGRTQELIYHFNKIYESYGKEDYYRKFPVYIDSPMAVDATKVFMKNSYVFDDEAKGRIQAGDNIFDFEGLHYISSVDESKMLNNVRFPRVIISSSGMATAGRVRHHLKHNLWDDKSAVIFVGYQAHGSLGRLLVEGADIVKIAGEEIKVNAKIHQLQGFSAHADQNMLLNWLGKIEVRPKTIFLVHGEVEEAMPLASKIESEYGIETIVPDINSTVNLYGLDRSHKMENKDFGTSIRDEIDDFKISLSNLKGIDFENFETLPLDKQREIRNKIRDINKNLMDMNMLIGK